MVLLTSVLHPLVPFHFRCSSEMAHLGEVPSVLSTWMSTLSAGVGQHLAVAPVDAVVQNAEVNSLTVHVQFDDDVAVGILIRQG